MTKKNDKARIGKLLDDANAALDAEDESRAVELFTEAMSLDPADATLVQSRGAVHAMTGDMDAAIADYTRAIELAAGYADAYLNRGLAYWELKRYEETTRDLAKAVDLGLSAEETEVQALYFLARAHEALGQADRAYPHYLRITVLAPDTAYGKDAAARSLSSKARAEGTKDTKKAKPPAKSKKR